MVSGWLQDNPGGVVVIATTWPIVALATFITGLRLYSRKLKKLSWEMDDYLTIVGLVRNHD